MGYLAILLCMFVSTINCSFEIKENVIFQKVNEIYMNDAKWLVTFVHDLAPFKHLVLKINHDINQTQAMLDAILKTYDAPNDINFVSTFKGIKIEMNLLMDSYDAIQSSFLQYDEIRSDSKLTKRSVLPIVGEIFSALFGTVSESDLENINQNINILANNQQQIIHDLQYSITALNLTQIQVSKNRKALVQLVSMINGLNSEIRSLASHIDQRFIKIEKFIYTYLQIQTIIDEIKIAIQNILEYFDNLKLELSMLSMNHLSINTISPIQLKSILKEIEDQLPIGQKLPQDPDTNLWYYYKNLQCTTYIQDDKIQIILIIPLLNIKHIYEIYKVINIPIPIKTNQSTENNYVISAKYALEAHAFMIAKDRSYYALLNKEELNTCKNTQLKFCNPNKPLFPSNLNRNCLMTLFNKDRNEINTYCEKNIVHEKLPNAQYIENNVYIVFLPANLKAMTFQIFCSNQKSYSLDILQYFQILKLNSTCSAHNKYMTLQSFSEGRSKMPVNDVYKKLLVFNNLTNFQIWHDTVNISQHLINLNMSNDLKTLKEIPVSDLYSQMYRSYPKINKSNKQLSFITIMSLIASSCIIMIIVIMITKRLANRHGICNCLRVAAGRDPNSAAEERDTGPANGANQGPIEIEHIG